MKLGLDYDQKMTIVVVTLRKMQSSMNEMENYRSEPNVLNDEDNIMCWWSYNMNILTWLG